MPKAIMQTDFSAGYWSRKMDGRLDYEQYTKACSELKNFLVIPQGGVTMRPGMRFIADLGVISGAIRIIPLSVADNENFAIILSHNKVQVWNTDTETLMSTKTTSDSGYEDLPSSAEIPLIRWEQMGYAILMTVPEKDPFYIYVEKDGV